MAAGQASPPREGGKFHEVSAHHKAEEAQVRRESLEEGRLAEEKLQVYSPRFDRRKGDQGATSSIAYTASAASLSLPSIDRFIGALPGRAYKLRATQMSFGRSRAAC